MAKLPVPGPLDEARLDDDLRADPVRAQPRQALGPGEWRLRNLESVQPRTQIEQEFGVEAGTDLSGETEVFFVEIADQQRSQPHSLALWIGEAADDEGVGLLAFHLQPMLRPAMLVRRVAALRDDAFPSFGASALPRLWIVQQWHLRQRQPERDAAQQRATLVERQARHVSAIEPQDVEHVVVRLAEGPPPPGGFAIEDDVVNRQVGDGLDDRWMGAVERQPVPGEQADVGSILKRKQPDAVELALEEPLGPAEPVLGERRRHRFEPVGKRGHHNLHAGKATDDTDNTGR